MMAKWIRHADTLILMNAQFDLLYLRAFSPLLRALLNGRHTIIDLAAINFLESDVRPERSLKTIGPVLLTHSYEATASQQFHRNDTGIQQMHQYNAEDTHNTIRAVAELARRLTLRSRSDPTFVYPGPRPSNTTSDLLSSNPVTFYSDLIWSCIQMSENGVPYSRPRLEAYESRLLSRLTKLQAECEARSLLLSGPGSTKSKLAFLEAAVCEAEAHQNSKGNLGLRENPNLQYTEKTKNLKTDDANRNFIAENLPPSSPALSTLRLWGHFSRFQKLYSSYVYPMLHHRRNKPDDRKRVLLPCDAGRINLRLLDPSIHISYPTWFIVPSSVKDGSGSSGGTQQARITCKDGPHQTDPPAIKRFRTSRFRSGSLVSIDLSQIELRVAALLSGDRAMVSEYAREFLGEKSDLHASMARDIFGSNVHLTPGYGSGDSARDPRQWAKQINFLVLFAGGPNKCQETLLRECGREFPIEECQRIVYSARAARPDLIRWQDVLVDTAHKSGRITVPILGQSRTFAPGGKYDKNEIVNFPIQLWAGNILIQIQSRLARRLRDNPLCLMYLNVYDALYFDVANDLELDRLRTMIQEEVDYVANEGYWHQLQELTGVRIPLKYDFSGAH